MSGHRTWVEVRSGHYTDTCLVIGPNLRWTEDDFQDLHEAFPEVFLGYRIKLIGPSRRAGLGYHPKKVISFYTPMIEREYAQALVELHHRVAMAEGVWEHWYVHRGRGIELLNREDYRDTVKP